MLTCFIRTEFDSASQVVTVAFFLVIPVLFTGFCTYLSGAMYFSKKVHQSPKHLNMYFRYIIYSTVYMIFNSPVFLLYIISLWVKIEPDTTLSWFSYVNLPIMSVQLYNGGICPYCAMFDQDLPRLHESGHILNMQKAQSQLSSE